MSSLGQGEGKGHAVGSERMKKSRWKCSKGSVSGADGCMESRIVKDQNPHWYALIHTECMKNFMHR